MLDTLTIAAELTAMSLIGFCTIGFLAYAWKRSAPVAVVPSTIAAPSATETKTAATEKLLTKTDIQMPPSATATESTLTADEPATPTVKRPRKVSTAKKEVMPRKSKLTA